MSHFTCEQCGTTQYDSEQGYIAGCCHHPPEHSVLVKVWFGGENEKATLAYCKGGVWYRSIMAEKRGEAVHPVRWDEVNANTCNGGK